MLFFLTYNIIIYAIIFFVRFVLLYIYNLQYGLCSRLLLGDTSDPDSIWPTGDPAEEIVRKSAPIRARLDGSTPQEDLFHPFS